MCRYPRTFECDLCVYVYLGRCHCVRISLGEVISSSAIYTLSTCSLQCLLIYVGCFVLLELNSHTALENTPASKCRVDGWFFSPVFLQDLQNNPPRHCYALCVARLKLFVRCCIEIVAPRLVWWKRGML